MRVYIKTFGCQMNERDSQRVVGLLGGNVVDDPNLADVIILNTCAVREKPVHKVYSELGKLQNIKRKREDVIIGVMGCVAQLYGEKIIKKMPFTDFVIGTQVIHKIPKIVEDVKNGKKVVDTSIEVNFEDRFLSPINQPYFSPVSAYVPIQEGCDQFCTFCIVPITRGREIARPSDDIIREVVELASRGIKEVILLGQNVNGYGRNIPGERNFTQLLRELNNLPIFRIRFTTSNPRYVDDEQISAVYECKKVCKHWHLPVQSGSNRILKKMARRYTREEYLEIVSKLKKLGIAITTDIIVGFPGETEKDFEETLSLLREVEFDDIFSFKFSPRPGTAAARMSEQIPDEEKSRRLWEVQKLQNEITLKKMMGYVGKIVDVLVEGEAERGQGLLTGRTDDYKIVNFKPIKSKIGDIAKVKITFASRNSLKGEEV